MQDSLFNFDNLIYASDQINTIGARWFRDAFWLSQWDPTRVGGYPTIDATYSSPYHPLMIFHFLMDPGQALSWLLISTILVAFVSMTTLASYISKDWKVGGLFGVLFALNPQFVTHLYPGHDGKMIAISIIPFGVYCIIKLLREKWYWGSPLFALCSAWVVIGHIQIAYFFFWGILFISLYENFIHCKAANLKAKSIKQILIGFGLIAGLGICSLQIIPPYSYTTNFSVRAEAEQKSYGHAVSWSNHIEETISILLPNFVGNSTKSLEENQTPYWGHNPFKLNHDSPGILLLILGLLSFTYLKFWKRSSFLMISIAFLVIYSVGSNTPFFRIFYEIVPGAKSFRAPSMVLFWVPILLTLNAAPFLSSLLYKNKEAKINSKMILYILFVAFLMVIARYNWLSVKGFPFGIVYLVVSAFTLFTLFKKESIQKKVPFGLKISILLILISFSTLAFSIGPSLDSMEYFRPVDLSKDLLINSTANGTIMSFIWISLICLIIWYFLIQKKPGKYTIIPLLAIGAINAITTTSPYMQTIPRNKVLPNQSQWSSFFKKHMPDSLNDFRVYSPQNTLNSNYGPYFNIRFLEGTHDNKLSTFRSFKGGRSSHNFMYQIQKSTANINKNPFLNLMGVRLIILNGGNGIRFFVNDSAFKRTTLYSSFVLKSHSEIPDYLRNENFDYRKQIIFDSIDVAKISSNLSKNNTINSDNKSLNYSKIIKQFSPSKYQIESYSDQEGWVLFNENYHPDWRIMIDQKSVEPIRAFHTLIAFEVPKGKSTALVEFKSQSVESSKKWVWIGMFIFLILIIISFLNYKKNQATKV
jgi:hypothetical protein